MRRSDCWSAESATTIGQSCAAVGSALRIASSFARLRPASATRTPSGVCRARCSAVNLPTKPVAPYSTMSCCRWSTLPTLDVMNRLYAVSDSTARCDDVQMRRGRAQIRRASVAVTLAAGVGLFAACSPDARNGPGTTSPGTTSRLASPSGARDTRTSWTSYHANDARTGAVAADSAALTPSQRAWSVELGGAVRGQPLVVGGRVIAATETNRVVALDPGSGKVLWSRALGKPLRNVVSVAGCGNIDPLGITSTPVADPATGTVYVVGEIDGGNGSVHH